MVIPTDSLDDYLGKSIAGFKQGQTFYERAHSDLKAKERLSVSEFFLLKSFDHDQKYLVEFMTEATDKEDLYARIIKGKYLSQEFDYKKLANLEKRLNEAKEKSEVVDLTVTKYTGGFDPWSAGIANATTYLGITVKDWYFKGTTLHITPKKPYEYRTKRYIDGKFDSIEDCGTVHRWDIEVKDPIYQRVEISSGANNNRGIK